MPTGMNDTSWSKERLIDAADHAQETCEPGKLSSTEFPSYSKDEESQFQDYFALENL